MERLQRVLASAGIASRRRAEELITDGRVRVDGQVVTELGTRVDPDRQKIEVDGKLIPHPRRRYIVLHKPKGYITTMSDERDRMTVMDLVHVSERVVPVGRLDRQTEGLLLLTNDGELAHRVMHPRFELDKEYDTLLDGHPPPQALDRLRRGVVVDGERTVPKEVRPIRNTEDGTIVRVVIHEGRNRIVRRMFEEVGYPVLRLVRTRIGPLQLGSIPRGHWRDLTEGELQQLREALGLSDEEAQFQERTQRRIGAVPARPQRPAAGRPGQRGSRESRPARTGGGSPGQGSERRGPGRPGTGPARPSRPGSGPSRQGREDAGPSRPGRPASGPPRQRRPDDSPPAGDRPRRPAPRRNQGGPPSGPRRERP